MKTKNRPNRISFYLMLLTGMLLVSVLIQATVRGAFADPAGTDLTPTVEANPTTEPTEEVTPTPEEDVPTAVPDLSETPTESLTPTAEVTSEPADETPTPVPSVTQGPTPTKGPTHTPTPTAEVTSTPTPYATVIPPDKETNYNVKETNKAANVSAIPAVNVDGAAEELWSWYPTVPLENTAWGESGASGTFQIIWTKSTLYVLVRVTDASYDVASELFSRKDCVEVFLNEDGTLPSEYGAGDQHYLVSRSGEIKYGSGGDEATFSAAVSETEDGYLVEMAIPFQTIQASQGTVLGFDVRINDSQGQGNRDYMVQWSDTSMQTNTDLSQIGTVTLQ